MNNNPAIAKLFRMIQENPLSARQGLDTEEKTAGMLCRTAEFESHPDLFYLVTEIDGDRCDIIPGSLDGFMAGPDDIVLPKSVLGDFIFLSMDLSATLPLNALGKGFAMLDDPTYNRIIDSQIKYETGEDGDSPSYPMGLPYIGKSDSRIAYHKAILKLVQHAQESIYSEVFANGPEESGKADILNWFSQHFVPVIEFPEAAALAAGSEKKNIQTDCAVEGFGGTVILEYSRMEKALHIDFYKPSGEIEQEFFENWRIAASDGAILGSIHNGSCIIPMAEFDCRICLLDPDNAIHAFIAKKE